MVFEATESELAEHLPLSLGGGGHPGKADQLRAGPRKYFHLVTCSNGVWLRQPASALSSSWTHLTAQRQRARVPHVPCM